MSIADVLIIIFVTLIMLSILFFSFIFPRIRNKKNHCSNCPVGKDVKIKRAFKDYQNSKK